MTTPPRSSDLTSDLADAEAQLLRIEEERTAAAARVTALRAELAAADAAVRVAPPSPPALGEPGSASAKAKLFLSLFRGRDDVYPVRFEPKPPKKAGYAPDCANKFVRGLCELPKVKCGECENQGFRPFDEAAVLRHLKGEHVMGVYPMLPDETCWFLAVDFDKGGWRDDVRAFVAAARRRGLPVAVERSRSGNGAHVWFFFDAPVAASTARKMGCHLITEAMASRHELGMDSYDRLFPSQDTMPRGGFGNLIALPFQLGPRRAGNSVFLDEQLEPYPKERQWSYLASVQRIAPEVIEAIASDAMRDGAVVGVRLAEAPDEAEAAPWTRSPSRKRRPPRIDGPLPPRVAVTFAQQLFVAKTALPSSLLNEIKRLAAFQNPEFYKKQSMRLSTAMTPRVIACAEDLPLHIGLPRGCLTDLEELLRGHGIALDVGDERTLGGALDLTFRGELTPAQGLAARTMLADDVGVFVAPPGTGKTVIGAYLIAARGRSTLVLVHRLPLLEQWVMQLSCFLGIDKKEIGQIGGGKRLPNGRLDVAMIQSLVRKDSVADLVASYGQVIVDECHHLAAVQFERVLKEVKARYVVGLTATPQRRDGHQPITEMQLGPVRLKVDARAQAEMRPFEHRLVVRETTVKPIDLGVGAGIQEVYGALARDVPRNSMILDDVIRALEEGRSPILLTERREHLAFFANRLARLARHLVVLQGGMGAKADREVRAKLAAIPPHEERLLLATGRYIGEGFDDARLDTLFLALPVAWKGTLVQYAGRLHRLHPGKREVRIYDYVDREVPVLLRMFEKRLRGYRSIGYARGEAPLGFAEPDADLLIEYDEDVVRALDRDAETEPTTGEWES
jgi:superfamily II DNA or RNA helicase